MGWCGGGGSEVGWCGGGGSEVGWCGGGIIVCLRECCRSGWSLLCDNANYSFAYTLSVVSLYFYSSALVCPW